MASRARKKADDIYNARRRAKRLLNRLSRDSVAGLSFQEQRALQSYELGLYKQIYSTYQSASDRAKFLKTVPADVRAALDGRKPVADFEKAKQAASNLDIQTKRDNRSAASRRNEIFKREIRLASTGDASTALGKFGKANVKIFYAATQSIWEGIPYNKRDNAIMNALDVDSLREAYRMVLSGNVSAVREAAQYQRGYEVDSEYTDEGADFYEDMGAPDEEGSPDYLLGVGL